MTGERFDGWIPIRTYRLNTGPFVEWAWLGNAPFSDPFLLGTVQRALESPFASLFRRHTPFAELRGWREVSPGVPPAGFIFHSSRCGSTLITRMLAQLPRNLVLSEPEPVEAVAHSAHASFDERVEWLRDMISALAQPRTGAERSLFVKLEPRDIFLLPLYRAAYPEVPWIFLYRDPLEVLASNIESPPGYLMSVAALAGIDAARSADSAELIAAVLGAVLERAAAAFPDDRGLLVHYRELPDALWGSIARHFGIGFEPEEIAAFQAAAQFDAKRPAQKFAADGARKSAGATPRMRELCARLMEPHFARLEALRVS